MNKNIDEQSQMRIVWTLVFTRWKEKTLVNICEV